MENNSNVENNENKKREWFSILKLVLIALGVAFVVRTFLFSPIIVDGPSMQPTLYSKDQMIVNKITYKFKQPERFDIVVFHASEQKDFIKRVIGLPGDHVMIQDDILYINGEPVAEPFLDDLDEDESLFPVRTEDFRLEELKGNYERIPEGYIFVLGDNRHNSTDSRHDALGLVPLDEVVGKTNVIYWPPSRMQIVQ
jgi:signal peptidase I